MGAENLHSYLIVFNNAFASREEVTDLIDRIPDVVNWRADLPNCVLAISNLSASALSETLAELNIGADGKTKGQYLVAEVGKNKQGWLPKSMWRMMNEKHLPDE